MRYIKRVLNISHDLERKSQFLVGPRQTGKTSWIREELDGVRCRFNLLDKKLVKAALRVHLWVKQQISCRLLADIKPSGKRYYKARTA